MPTTAVATTAVATTAVATTAVATTAVATAPPSPPTPTDLAGLIALLELDPGAAGRAGRPLLNELRRIAEGAGERAAATSAAELIVRVDEWVEKDQLDPEVAQDVRAVLAPIAAAGGEPGGDGDE